MSTHLRNLRKWVIAVVASLSVSACLPVAQNGADLSNLSFSSICMKDDLSMIGFLGGLSLSGSESVDGDVLLFEGMNFQIGGNANVTGKVHMDTSSSYTSSGSASVGHGYEQSDHSREKKLLEDFVASISALTPAQEFDTLTAGQVIQGRGGVNVIHVRKGIQLSGHDRVILQGGTNDVFLINVDGDVQFSGNSAIVVQGGVSSKRVAINVIGTGSDVALSGNASVGGTMIAMNRAFTVLGNCKVDGAIVAGLQINLFGNVSTGNGGFCVIGQGGDTESNDCERSRSRHHKHWGDSGDDVKDQDDHPVSDHDENGGSRPNPVYGGSCGQPAPAPSVTPAPTTSPAPTAPTTTTSPLPCGGVVCSGGTLGV